MRRLACAGALACLLASTAAAAEPPQIRPGQTLSGALQKDDRLEPDGSYFDVFALQGRAGQNVAIDMSSRDLDSVVALYVEGHDGPIAINNNADRRGRDARIDIVLPSDGRYLIVANSAEPGESGRYRLSVRETRPVAAARPGGRTIGLGKTVQGELSARSGRAGDASLYDLYQFRGRAGDRVRLSLASNDFEPYLSLHKAGQAMDLAFGRDQGQRSAEVAVTLPVDGDYEIWANAATPGQTGRYSLWLGRDGAVVAPDVRPIAYGDTVRGELTAGDAKARDDSLYDVYRFKAARGDEVTVTMRSPMLEAFLAIHRQGQEGSIATASDDGFGGRDAELSFVAPVDGFYDVWANTLGAGQRGAYVISLERIGRRTGEVARNP
ncbi:MAG: peptidase [Caulobacteraceae bacterium]|nr:peptidase [Caulobacteraceae bacterium]